jgi:hypothetical protein
MKPQHFMRVTIALFLCLASVWAGENELTPAEKTAGWRLLFDGKTTQGWRSYSKPGFPDKGWIVEDGWLKLIAKSRAGDIMTEDTFNDFELTWEWRIPVGANNGVKYFILEERKSAIGHEYQMIDDSLVKPGILKTGSFYDVLPPLEHKPILFAPGSNVSRILVRGDHVEHWLNGEKILSYELGSPEVMAGVAKSKFKNVLGFGQKQRGHILLTEHNDEAWFRNIKIRDLSAAKKE